MLNEKKFRAIYDDFLASGLTTRDYCANQQMNEAKFYYWQNKLKGQLPPKRGFVPVFFNPPRPTSAPAASGNKQQQHSGSRDGLCCEINYPNGVRVKLEGVSNPEMLRSLLLLTHP